MSEICPTCGLPKDLCVCEEISKEQQQIKIRLEKRRWGKGVTVIEGIDERSFSLKDLAATLKSRCACGGTAKGGKIELQGDHREKARKLLVQLGFQDESIFTE